MALHLRIRRALDKEYPVKELAKVLPTSHHLRAGLSAAHMFESFSLDMPMSEVPDQQLVRYNKYLEKCRAFIAETKTSK